MYKKKSEDSNGKITFTIVKELPFCTEVEVNLDDIVQQNDKTYYRCTYYYLSSTAKNFKEKENYYLETTTFDELERRGYREDYLNTFPIKEAQQLSVPVKRAIIGYFYSNDIYDSTEKFCFTQDANRIKKAIVTADFNMDEEKDVAVILEREKGAFVSSEDKYKAHRLLVLCYNKDIGKSYVAYSNYHDNYPAVINAFNKDAKIFINSENLVSAPNNGIIYEILGGDVKIKYAIFYNFKTMQFEEYLQKPLSEIQKEYEQDSEYEEEIEQDSEETGE